MKNNGTGVIEEDYCLSDDYCVKFKEQVEFIKKVIAEHVKNVDGKIKQRGGGLCKGYKGDETEMTEINDFSNDYSKDLELNVLCETGEVFYSCDFTDDVGHNEEFFKSRFDEDEFGCTDYEPDANWYIGCQEINVEVSFWNK